MATVCFTTKTYQVSLSKILILIFDFLAFLFSVEHASLSSHICHGIRILEEFERCV